LLFLQVTFSDEVSVEIILEDRWLHALLGYLSQLVTLIFAKDLLAVLHEVLNHLVNITLVLLCVDWVEVLKLDLLVATTHRGRTRVHI
jgi:hypothetical protein